MENARNLPGYVYIHADKPEPIITRGRKQADLLE
jgi:hypothetical protein